MAKLYFRYGAMGAAKTLNLLAVAANYRHQGKKVLLVKPTAATRDGEYIASRSGQREAADVRLGPNDVLQSGVDGAVGDYACVLVDEAQFLTVFQVEGLRTVAIHDDVPVICYGLRCDYTLTLFPGSKRLMELADTIEEVKTTCQWCDRKATQNYRVRAEGTDQASWYAPACFACFMRGEVGRQESPC